MELHLEELNTPEGQRTVTLVVEGELGAQEFTELADVLFRLASQAVTNVVLDFTDLSHLDYRMVKPLLARTELFRAAGGDIKLAGLSPYLHAILRSVGAHQRFALYAAPEDALSAFALSRPERSAEMLRALSVA